MTTTTTAHRKPRYIIVHTDYNLDAEPEDRRIQTIFESMLFKTRDAAISFIEEFVIKAARESEIRNVTDSEEWLHFTSGKTNRLVFPGQVRFKDFFELEEIYHTTSEL